MNLPEKLIAGDLIERRSSRIDARQFGNQLVVPLDLLKPRGKLRRAPDPAEQFGIIDLPERKLLERVL
ncbi:MAG: hypothetical protein D6695_06715 [Planctomycetota bacterium]|nr:MAG: hypothetical protein D6695_06715 [Planctomycetota bacterium]